MLWLYAAVTLAADAGHPAPKPFADRAAQVKPGDTRARVRALIGEPTEGSGTDSWHYRDPPNRPDGPYHWWRFTFVKEKVSKVEHGGVACVTRE